MSSLLAYTGCVVSLSHGSCWSTGAQKPDLLHFAGVLPPRCSSGLPLWGNSSDVPHHDDRELSHHHSCNHWPCLAHPHVLFSQKPGFDWNLLYAKYSPQDACGFVVGEKGYLLFRLCPATLLCHILHHFWVFPFGCHGIWPIRGYMPSFALQRNNEQECVFIWS